MFKFDKAKEVIVVTGGTGFLGRHVCEELKTRGYKNVRPMSHTYGDKNPNGETTWVDKEKVYCDLLTEPGANRAVASYNGEVKGVIHLAAVVGGIGANQANPGSFMYDNLKMGLNVIEAVRKSSTMRDGGKLVQIATVCAYPKFTPVPFKESFIWDGYPEETNAPYGIAKKALMELVKAYNRQYKDSFKGISLIPVNLYGPGDNFNPDSSHVIPALIKKVYEAKINNLPEVSVWGTGNASREFLYVKDAAKGVVDAFEKYDGDDPINLGTGKEIKISALIRLIIDIMDYKGGVYFETSKPDGQPRRCLDVSKAKEEFGFQASTDFEQGLKETIDWYINRTHS
jgi:GDP-L-fucose synthase